MVPELVRAAKIIRSLKFSGARSRKYLLTMPDSSIGGKMPIRESRFKKRKTCASSKGSLVKSSVIFLAARLRVSLSSTFRCRLCRR